MINTKVLILVLGLSLVTYIPRMLPVFISEKIVLNEKIKKFLKLMPYTAMAALIFPGIIKVDENPLIGLSGAIIAIILAWKKCPVIICVLASVLVNFIMFLLI